MVSKSALLLLTGEPVDEQLGEGLVDVEIDGARPSRIQ
jgi:hypothetical protein